MPRHRHRYGDQTMTRLELIQTPNRRMGGQDRRHHSDRRGRPMEPPITLDTIDTLRDLLDKSHARIRTLERMVEDLRKDV